MQELPLTSGAVLSMWWLLLLRSVIVALALSFMTAIFAALIAPYFGTSEAAAYGAGMAGFAINGLVWLLWTIWVTRMALTKQYKSFRIVLVQID